MEIEFVIDGKNLVFQSMSLQHVWGKTVLQFTAMKTAILKNFLLPYWSLLHPLLRPMKPTL